MRRAPFRWTSFGDLATPNTAWVLSYGQSRLRRRRGRAFQPLFHLLNGDLCYANLNPTAQPAVWADFGNNNQASAAHRPWMPCPGNHEVEFDNGPQGFTSYLTRYTLPANGAEIPGALVQLPGRPALFISLDADDVIYQDARRFRRRARRRCMPAASTGQRADRAGHVVLHQRLPRRRADALAGADAGGRPRQDDVIDWIIVQMHQDALSRRRRPATARTGHPRDLAAAVRQYGVDLVVCGHDHDYERSFPVRGFDRRSAPDARPAPPWTR